MSICVHLWQILLFVYKAKRSGSVDAESFLGGSADAIGVTAHVPRTSIGVLRVWRRAFAVDRRSPSSRRQGFSRMRENFLDLPARTTL